MESEDQDTLCPASSSEFEELEPPDLVPPGDTGGAGGDAGPYGQPLPAGTATMLRARLLARMAMDDLRPEAGPRQSSASHVQKLREECQAARSRIQANVSSVSKVFEMTRSLESYILNLEDCKNRIRQNRNARWSDLAVCQRRLEILSQLDWCHEKLPLKKGTSSSQPPAKPTGASTGKSQAAGPGGPTRSRGSLVEGLEVEQEALLVLRRELGALIENELDPALETALDLRRRLQQEASERRKLMRKDHATLTGGDSEREDDASSKSLDSKNFWVKKAQNFEESAQHLLQKAMSTIQWTDLEYAQANQCVAQCLAQCSREDQRLRRQLDAQLRDVDFAISCADWTINKPENRLSETASAQVERAQVLLHELTGTRKQLKCLVRKCKKDLQILESCRNTTVHTLQPHTLQSLTQKKAEKEKNSAKVNGPNGGWEEPKSKTCEACDACETENEVQHRRQVAHEAADLEDLRHLQAEERRLRSNLRSYETRIERCAMWSEVLADLEDCLVAEPAGS